MNIALPLKEQGKGDVLLDVEFTDELIVLEHEPELSCANGAESLVVKTAELRVSVTHLTATRGLQPSQ
jgi:hypothetical protein